MSFRLPTVVSGITQSVTQLGNAVTGRGGDARYFQSTKKGEIQELKEDLHSTSKEKKKETVKKVIAAMTIGKDVSTLFPDVVNCMQTSNIELKKLVYLYVINYAKVQPELAVLAINTFRKDSLDANPLIRALAVRTMGCIRLDQVVEYLLEPLRRACKDSDPYVRKTAATCICKLYDTSPEAVEEQGFMTILQDMLLDTNPTVVANAVASLSEISEASGNNYLQFTESIVSRLLTALGECSEWGQVFILDALASYTPPDAAAAASVLDRVTARLSHANAAVVLSTIRIVIRMLDYVDDANLIRATQRKLGPPLVTLLSAESEIQYVALRNISLIVQKYPSILANEVKMFFCKYNDPHYVKMEKLEILIRLTTDYNVEQVLQELKEYATEVDVEFVRRTIRAIGRCAIKLERAAESLIETRVNYVVQETIVVMKDIFRKYPNRYESVISTLCENLTSLDEPEAKAAIVWIIGEYAQRIENADELLETFLEGFHDEPVSVRQQILTATVKLFLKCPARSQELVTRVLKLSTEKSDDPDLRDRGFIYWRLLSTDPEATKKVVLAQKPVISEEAFYLEPDILDKLVQHISTLASVFHRVPESFVMRLRATTSPTREESSEASVLSDGEHRANPEEIKAALSAASQYQSGDDEDAESSSSSSTPSDLLDIGGDEGESSEDAAPSETAAFSGSSTTDAVSPPLHVSQWPVLLSPEVRGTNGNMGLGIRGYVGRSAPSAPCLYLSITNNSGVTLAASAWAIQINKNSFGFAPQNPTNLGLADLQPNHTAATTIPLSLNVNLSQTPPTFPLALQVALRTSLDIFYLAPVPYEISAVFGPTDAVTKDVFRNHWQRMGTEKQAAFMGLLMENMTHEDVAAILEKQHQLRLIVTREQEAFDTIYMAAVTTNKLLLLFEISVQKRPGRGIKITMRADATPTFPILQDFFTRTLKISQTRPA